MPRQPLVTVAIPTYNGAEHLEATLRSVLIQSTRASIFELLVCDDRSSDATLDVVGRVVGDRARVVVGAEPLGLAGNWNRCLELSRAPFVAILHQDDVWLPGHLGRHLAAIEAEPGLALIAGPTTTINAEDRPLPDTVVDPGGLGAAAIRFEPGAMLAAMADRNPLRCSAVTLNRAVALEAGGFDPAWRYVVDWEFWCRVTARHPALWLGGEPSVRVRWHPRSETQRFRIGTEDLDESCRLLEQISARLASRPQGREVARSRGRSGRRRLARAYLNRAWDAVRDLKDPALARRSLISAVRLSGTTVLRTLATDPRLAARLAIGLPRRGPSRTERDPARS